MNNPPHDAAPEGQEEWLRQVSPEQLKEILGKHEQWLESDGDKGERANLSQCDLREANLQDANLRRAALQDAKLEGADLTRADLGSANLWDANLQRTYLRELRFDRRTWVMGLRVDAVSLAAAPLFKRHVEDFRFIDAFQNRHPRWAWLWRISCDYGRSLGRWAAWSAVFALAFGLLYSPAPSWLPNSWPTPLEFSQAYETWFSPFYFSIVTFTTLGFGDYTPASVWGEFAVMTEVVLGYVMLGGLISIFANKLARRS